MNQSRWLLLLSGLCRGRSRRHLLMTCLLVVIGLGMLPALGQAQNGGKPGKGGGGKKPKSETVFALEIVDTADLQGDQKVGVSGLTEYLDHRLFEGAVPATSECVTGMIQNSRRGNKSFGAFVDLDRGSSKSTDPDFAGCNDFHSLAAGDRRTFTMSIADQCVCDLLGAPMIAGACSVTPDVAGDNANPRVTASTVVGGGDATRLHFHWDVTEPDASKSRYTLRSIQDLPFTNTPSGDQQLIRFATDPANPDHDFELVVWTGTGQCLAPIPFGVDVTFVLHEVTQ